MIHITLRLLDFCNKSCSYCFSSTNKYTITKEQITQDLPKYLDIISYEDIGLSGGEPGLLPYDIVELLLNTLYQYSCTRKKIKPIFIFTNGLFLKKYEQLLTRFSILPIYVVYHIADETFEPITHYAYPRIRYSVVLTDSNYRRVYNTIKSYENYKFTFNRAHTLSDDNYKIVCKQYNALRNVVHKYPKYTECDTAIQKCLNTTKYLTLDFGANTIYKCCAMVNTPPLMRELTLDNVKSILYELPQNNEIEFCKNSYPLCSHNM